MSATQRRAKDFPLHDGKVIAALDTLFSEPGIAIPGDGARVILLAEAHHTLKYHSPGALGDGLKGKPQARFEGGEHTAIGDGVLLRFAKDAPAIPAWQVELHLTNGLALTYGQIVALGADFYGIPERPIADGNTQADRQARFTASFNSLAVLPASREEAQQILQVMKTEINAANQAIRDGRQPHEAYDELGDSLSGEWNKITGGGSFASPLYPLGRYLKLAASNWDHFGEWALLAYQAGHAAALQQAVLAHASGADQDLELAYAMNAFADHFLTDLFSGGHLRVPRKQLADSVTPSDVGSLISRFMHDEDSKFGLKVSNDQGDQWNCHGDKRYFDTIDSSNRLRVKQAVQQSVDEVFAVFLSGSVVPPEAYAALRSVPDLKKLKNSQDRLNFAPLFALKGNTVMRRNDVNNLNDRSQSDSWWGWSTYLLLKDYKPNKPAGYLNPPGVAPTIKADGWQSQTPSDPNWLPGNAVRYAFSYTKGLDESYSGPWTAYAELSERFQPTLNVPVDASVGATARHVFRQFRGGSAEPIGTLDSQATTFIDNHQ
ncbi:phospholipase [Pseudomonas sp. FEN]|uniref:phospholipase n=1 Tax=Pseudomonas sp. FEN TaxID=2767468 RepID=UPI001749A9BA|nr:phospholipase [Pseudomonas sp. FEN]CAD5199298.1 Phosphatidylcholine-hydrolyzing phospholipase C (EC 3.1.4.3) [Pseudomonas sp. FEN]